MDSNSLPIDTVRLFRLAEATARGLAQRHESLQRDEALLRAAIAWAQFARHAHLAASEHLKDCPKDASLLEAARRRRIRAEKYLCLRLTATIARTERERDSAKPQGKSELAKHKRLPKVAGLALALLH